MTKRAVAISSFLIVAGLFARSTPARAGLSNVAMGPNTLISDTSGGGNTAVGDAAMWKNSTGDTNSAFGMEALELNSTGSYNVALGATALLFSNADGGTAVGYETLYYDTTGAYNTALGFKSMHANTTGSYNVAVGDQALASNTTGVENTAVGLGALMSQVSGSYNVGVGLLAGYAYTGAESNNVAVSNYGVAGESGVIRIGTAGNQTKAFVAGIYGVGSSSGIPVYVNSSGQLGTVTSSLRFKEDVADLGAASDELMKLRPVTFHYKAQYDDGERALQYGLIAEEVAAVDPGLVQFGDDGKPLTVRYHFVNAMLLGEVQKQHATIAGQAARLEKQTSEIGTLKSTIASQADAIAALAERLAKLEAAAPRR